MRLLCLLLWLLTFLGALSPPVHSRSFPSTPDVTEAEQQRWGTQQRGYVTDHCWHGASASTTVTIASCRAYALEATDPPRLVGFEEPTPRTLTYSGGDGLYWLGGRWTPALDPVGWTCLPGTHYCWIKSATPPQPVSGLLVLGQSTVTSGAVTQFVILAPWRRTTPAVIAAGTTLTFGACPEAGRWPIWDANETTTGAVRFVQAPCLLYPEWWGIDPTGVVDGTALWNVVTTAAVAHSALPIVCEGVYRLSAAAGQHAITLRDNVHLVGTYQKGTHPPGTEVYPCKFQFYGTGSAFVLPDDGGATSHNDLLLENFTIEDMDRTGDYGLLCWRCTGSMIRRVSTYSFRVAFQFVSNFYYGEAVQLKARHPREIGLDFSANVNHTLIDVQCSAPDILTLKVCVSVSYPPAMDPPAFGTSRIPRLNIIAETSSGIPVYLARLNSVEAVIYIETPGDCANLSQEGLLQLVGVSGGSINAFVAHTCSVNGPLPVGIFASASGFPGPDVKNLELKGWVSGTFTKPVQLNAGAGSWGVTLQGLAIAGQSDPVLGAYTTGLRLANNILTHGHVPLDPNMGRDDRGTEQTRWKPGDVIFQDGGPGTPILTNRLYMVARGGDTPEVVSLVWPTTTEAVGAAADATPALRIENVWATRVLLEPSAVPVTDFINFIESQCVVVRVQAGGTRPIRASAIMKLKGVSPGSDLVLDEHTILHLCTNSGVWREVR